MFKKLLPVILLTAMALSACGPQPTAIAAPTSVPTVGATVNAASPTPTPAPYTDAATPCKPFNILDEVLSVKVPNLPPVTAEDYVIGAENAPITVISYSDLQCPHCATADGELEKLAAAYPNDVRLVFRHWVIFDNNDVYATRAAEAAGLQGKFFEYKKALFTEQSTWSPMEVNALETYLKAKAKDLGLDMAQFESDYNSDALKQKVEGFKTSGSALGFSGTPTVVINGAFYQDDWRFDVMSIIIRLILGGSKTADCPPTVVADGKVYSAVITTSKGDITLSLFADKAPQAVNSFIYQVQQGFYDNVPFYTVTDTFVLTGDATGTGYGNAGYAFLDENRADSKFDAEGLLGAYNYGAGLNGSVFFITKAAMSNIAGRYTNFGKVTAGLEVLKALVDTDTIISVNINEEK